MDGITRFAAQDGDQTTGGVIDFGPNDSSEGKGTNRALGLLSTGTTGSTIFALKLVNETAEAITNVSHQFRRRVVAQRHPFAGDVLWLHGRPDRGEFRCSHAESITNAVLVSNLFFSFPTAPVVTTVDGTQSSNQIDLATNDMELAAPWTPGGATLVVVVD